jgi:hypothetical protein
MTALSVAVVVAVVAAAVVGLLSRVPSGIDQSTSVKPAGTPLRPPESWLATSSMSTYGERVTRGRLMAALILVTITKKKKSGMRHHRTR